jgi:hypothetical protein
MQNYSVKEALKILKPGIDHEEAMRQIIEDHKNDWE